MTFPAGVKLVARVGADREIPLDRPILVCEGGCREFTAHVRHNMATSPDGIARVSYNCEECGARRRWGF